MNTKAAEQITHKRSRGPDIRVLRIARGSWLRWRPAGADYVRQQPSRAPGADLDFRVPARIALVMGALEGAIRGQILVDGKNLAGILHG